MMKEIGRHFPAYPLFEDRTRSNTIKGMERDLPYTLFVLLLNAPPMISSVLCTIAPSCKKGLIAID